MTKFPKPFPLNSPPLLCFFFFYFCLLACLFVCLFGGALISIIELLEYNQNLIASVLFLPPGACFLLKQEPTDLFYKGPERYFRLCRPSGLCCSYSTVLRQYESGHRQYMSLVPIKLYLQTLILEFHVMFTCHKIFF